MEIRLPQSPTLRLNRRAGICDESDPTHAHTHSDRIQAWSRALTNANPLNPPTITVHSLSFVHNTAQLCVYYAYTLPSYRKRIVPLISESVFSLQVVEMHCDKARLER